MQAEESEPSHICETDKSPSSGGVCLTAEALFLCHPPLIQRGACRRNAVAGMAAAEDAPLSPELEGMRADCRKRAFEVITCSALAVCAKLVIALVQMVSYTRASSNTDAIEPPKELFALFQPLIICAVQRNCRMCPGEAPC